MLDMRKSTIISSLACDVHCQRSTLPFRKSCGAHVHAPDAHQGPSGNYRGAMEDRSAPNLYVFSPMEPTWWGRAITGACLKTSGDGTAWGQGGREMRPVRIELTTLGL